MEPELPPRITDDKDHRDEPLTSRQSYNHFTDTVTGLNLRGKDNLFQALAIMLSVILAIAIGAFLAEDRWLGAVLGGGIGLLVGLFGSGTFLMIYRRVKHSRGQHD